jgi:hypothetical protein
MKKTVGHLVGTFIGVCGLIAMPVSLGLAAKPVAGSTMSSVEIVSPSVTVPDLPVYTVPAGHRLIITDVLTSSNCSPRHIYRDASEVSQHRNNVGNTVNHTYQSGIEFREGQTVRAGVDAGCGFPAFFELRGYLEPL